MALQEKWFFFEKYGQKGISILVRQSGTPTGVVIAEATLNDKKFGELLDLVGIEQQEPDENEVEPEAEPPKPLEEFEVSFPSTQPDADPDESPEDGDPVDHSEEKANTGFFRRSR